ncbi:uncharacterized protein [Watersipora subatra]|uniref:uncharacterized protein isoform X2 n=1 Tax=Watersipora subatra TaxID=2589382 RepID=UPI00355BCD4E
MDGEIPPVSSKRGRKSRSTKTKQSADLIQATIDATEQTSSVDGSEPSQSRVPSVGSATITDDDSISTASSSSIKTNDNLLMPPPSQPDNPICSAQDTESRKEAPQDHELIVDGFSIFCFGSEDEVGVAVEATGNAYTNKRMDYLLERRSTGSPRTPKLPSRDSNSPTSRRRTKSAQKLKEPKSPKESKPKQTKKAIKISPLVADSNGGSPAVSSTPSEMVALPVSSQPSTRQEIPPIKFTVKKEETETKYSDKKQSSGLLWNPPDIFKSDVTGPDYKIKSGNCKILSKPMLETREERSIKEERDVKDSKSSTTQVSTTHLLQAPPLKACHTPGKKELCSDEPAGVSGTSRVSSGERHSISSPFLKAAESPGGTEVAQHSSSSLPSFASVSTATALTSSTSTPPVISRSSSVHSVASSNSRRTTPVCTGSISSRDKDSGSIRTASRSSERNTSRGSQQPITSSGDQYAAPLLAPNTFGQVNPSMLSFGTTNGVPAPFSYPPGLAQPPSFSFGTDLLSSFSNNPSLSNEEALRVEALRAEFNRRMLSADRPTIPSLFRPELLLPTAAGMTNSPLAPNFSGAVLMQMLDKFPKLDPLHQLFYNQQSNNAVTSGAAVAGPSPFQSVPGGNATSSTSPLNAQKKSGKWCSAHVRIAYKILNASRTRAMAEEGKNGMTSTGTPASSMACRSTSSGTSNVTSSTDRQPVQPLSHSVSSLTSSVHWPKDTPHSSSGASPNLSSPMHQIPNSYGTSSSANFLSTAPSSDTVNSPAASNRSSHNGTLPSPQDGQWSSTPPHTLPSTSSSLTPAPTSKKRVRDIKGLRKVNGSSPQGKRPASVSSQLANKKRRSRSRSPPKSDQNRFQLPRQSNGHTIDKSVSSLPPAGMQQLLGAQFLPNLMNSDNKPVPSSGPPTAAPDIWSIVQQRDMESQRERYLAQINPALAQGVDDRTAWQLDRTKNASPLGSSGYTSINGFHHANSLSNLGSWAAMAGPPPLIPTSQSKSNSHHPQPTNTGSEGYRR